MLSLGVGSSFASPFISMARLPRDYTKTNRADTEMHY